MFGTLVPSSQHDSPPRSGPPQLQAAALLNQRLTRLECRLPFHWQARYQKVRLTLVITCSKLEAFLHKQFLYQLIIRRTGIPPLLLFFITLVLSAALTRRLYIHTASTIFQTIGFVYPALKTVQTLLSLDGETVDICAPNQRPSELHGPSEAANPSPSDSPTSAPDLDPLFAAYTTWSSRPSEWDYQPTSANGGNLNEWPKNSQTSRRWLLYWLLYGSLQLADHSFDWLLRFMPYYTVLRIVAVAWAQHPWSTTTQSFYRRVALPAYAYWLNLRVRRQAAGGPGLIDRTPAATTTQATAVASTPDSFEPHPSNLRVETKFDSVSRRASLSLNAGSTMSSPASVGHMSDTPVILLQAAARQSWDVSSQSDASDYTPTRRSTLGLSGHHPSLRIPSDNLLDPLTQPLYCMDSTSSNLTSPQFFQSPAAGPYNNVSANTFLWSDGGSHFNQTPTGSLRRRSQFQRASTPSQQTPLASTPMVRSRTSSSSTSTSTSAPLIRISARMSIPPDFLTDIPNYLSTSGSVGDASLGSTPVRAPTTLDYRELHVDPAFQPFSDMTTKC
ncbi:hypothetical protein BJ085DRAFT_33299 [Dimargaris cristalligena]|uniref:TB2/DP1, HVA22 family-domain-containing protein n=1 Tax=Dimargaris cristalligena TaxID=215637 RepID=A0A4P9ZVN3_9FUNG|nr:hypothetical protein BJ085DRAFT_33299 [Dimargaris cristalligena]|eukprot:RKP37657.1 hypothetical protein BJ085DRAFT_33299 [Dimargaris cristalligena]